MVKIAFPKSSIAIVVTFPSFVMLFKNDKSSEEKSIFAISKFTRLNAFIMP